MAMVVETLTSTLKKEKRKNRLVTWMILLNDVSQDIGEPEYLDFANCLQNQSSTVLSLALFHETGMEVQ